MNAARRWALAFAGIAALATATLVAPPTGASPPPNSGEMGKEWVAEAPSPSPPDNSKWSAETIALAREAAGMIETAESDFLGSYIDKDGRVVVVASSAAGRERVRARFGDGDRVSLADGAISINGATEFGMKLGDLSDALATTLDTWGPEPEIGGVFVELRRSPSEDDRRAIEELAAEQSVPVRLSIVGESKEHGGLDDSRPDDSSPYWGGARYAITDSYSSTTIQASCTSAFGYEVGASDYLLTAGHCYPRDSANDWMRIYIGGAPTGGSVTVGQLAGIYYSSTWNENDYASPRTVAMGADSGYHGDLSLVRVDGDGYGNTAGTRIWWGSNSTTSSIPVTDRINTIVGDDICINGMMSGTDCGLVVSAVNVNHTYTNPNHEYLMQGDKAVDPTGTHCSIPGDSGGSIVFDHPNASETEADAIGVISGHEPGTNGGCIQYFTSVGEAVEAWGGDLNLAP